MNHSSLKSQIKIERLTTRAQRSEANRLIRLGRKLRKQAADIRSSKAMPEKGINADRLHREGWDAHAAGTSLRDDAEAGRFGRRHMHLAAAMLNGKTYRQCESKYDPHRTGAPKPSHIAPHLAPYLPADERKHAEYIAETWIKQGNVRLSFIRDKGLVRLLTLDKKVAEIEALKRKLRDAEQAWKNAQHQTRNAESRLKAYQQDEASRKKQYDQLADRLIELEIELEDAKGEGAKTTCVADLFKEVA